MKNCPICGKEIEAYHEVTFKEPFIHNNPFDGIHIYGAYSSPKETICFENNFLHFAFYDANENLVDHRLIKLGVDLPNTKTPSQEYFEMAGEDDEDDDYYYDYDDDEDFEPCGNCDLPDACEDFGCAISSGVRTDDGLPF